MDDAKIVQLYLDRDEQAIPETANRYGNYCTSIAKNILGNYEDAEECVNDTYLNTWNAIPPHRPKMLSTFLGKIVRNLAFDRYKYNIPRIRLVCFRYQNGKLQSRKRIFYASLRKA